MYRMIVLFRLTDADKRQILQERFHIPVPVPVPVSVPVAERPSIQRKKETESCFQYRAVQNGVEITAWKRQQQNIVIPESINGVPIVSIAETAFTGIEAENVYISRYVRRIHSGVFSHFKRIANIFTDKNNAFFRDINGVLYSGNGEKLMAYPKNHRVNNNVVCIGAGVKAIGDYAFAGAEYVESVMFSGENITSVGNFAFVNSALCNIALPNSITEIGEYAFSGTSVKTVVLPSRLSGIKRGTFRFCLSLKNVELSDHIVQIEDGAFQKCGHLKNIALPKNLVSIGRMAFEGCRSLYFLLFPESMEYIGEYAFANCKRLQSVSLAENVGYLGKSAFSGCSDLNGVIIAGGKLRNISTDVFKGCISLERISILKAEVIEESAFEDCRALRCMTLPNRLSEIQRNAFRNCENLTDIYIPESVSRISEDAFSQCSYLTVHARQNTFAQFFALHNNIAFQSVTLFRQWKDNSYRFLKERFYENLKKYTSNPKS